MIFEDSFSCINAKRYVGVGARWHSAI